MCTKTKICFGETAKNSAVVTIVCGQSCQIIWLFSPVWQNNKDKKKEPAYWPDPTKAAAEKHGAAA